MKHFLLFCGIICPVVFIPGCGIFSSFTDTTEYTSADPYISDETKEKATPEETSGVVDPSSKDEPEIKLTGTYLGIKDYGYVNKDNVDDFGYRFNTDGNETVYKIADSASNGFYLQNQLKEGYIYDISAKNGFLNSVSQKATDKDIQIDTLVNGIPGEKTLKNFLTTALMPVGKTLYIYGGGWNWQDNGASDQARSIGISEDWIKFFSSKDAKYTYKDKDGKAENADASTSFYPYGGFNEYYYAGLDCSGYLGWTLYNTFETENGKEGYVFPSTENSKRLADRGWGSFRRIVPDTWHRDSDSVHPGDIISIKGHVWISLGTCKDGSVIMAHSSPSVSREGPPGGGVQLAALGDNSDCKAYHIAKEYMSKYYPEWYLRYEADLRKPEVYFDFSDERAGIFSWHTDGQNGGLTDPDGIKDMDPEKLLHLLYGEKSAGKHFKHKKHS